MDMSKRQKIINTSIKLFDNNGFHNTPTSKIAKESGVSVGTLFNYFPSKEDLIQEIYLEIKKRSHELIITDFKRSEDPYENIKYLWKKMVNWAVTFPDEFEFIEQFSHSPFIKKLDHDKIKSYFKEFQNEILLITNTENLCTLYPKFSKIYISNLFKATANYIIENKTIEQDHFIDYTFDMFWKSILK